MGKTMHFPCMHDMHRAPANLHTCKACMSTLHHAGPSLPATLPVGHAKRNSHALHAALALQQWRRH